MLVLSRKVDEEIVIAGNIRIKVCEVKSDGRVRLGIQAPIEVPVHRSEVWDDIQRENARKAKINEAQKDGFAAEDPGGP